MNKEIKELMELRTSLEEKITGIRNKIEAEKRQMTDEEVRQVEHTELQLRSINRSIAAVIQREQLRALKGDQKDQNEELRSFLKSAKPGQTYIMQRSVTTTNGGNAFMGLTTMDVIDVNRGGDDVFAKLGINIPTGVQGSKVVWPYAGGVEVSIADELATAEDRDANLGSAQAVPVRLTCKVVLSNQTLYSDGFDLVGYLKRTISKGLREKVAKVATSVKAANDNFKSGFAGTAEAGEYGTEGYTAGLVKTSLTELSYKQLTGMLGKLASHLYTIDGMTCFVMTPETYWTLKGTPKDSGSGLMVIDDNGKIGGVTVVQSTGMYDPETKKSYVGLGNFGYMPVMQHGDIRVSIDNASATAAEKDATIVVVNADFSMTVPKEVKDAFVLGEIALA